MTNHVPLCPVCREHEVGTFLGSDEFCSSTCESRALDWEGGDHQSEELCEDGEPHGSYDLSDDGDALASAGFGTDEDYGYYGDDF